MEEFVVYISSRLWLKSCRNVSNTMYYKVRCATIQGFDKKYWQKLAISDIALFTVVQHVYTFNIVVPLFISFSQMCGRRRILSARISLLMFRTDRPIPRISSSIVLHRAPLSGSFFMTMQGVTPLLLPLISCAIGNGVFCNIHLTHSIWVHAMTISSPKWKNLCEAPGTTQEMNLSVL